MLDKRIATLDTGDLNMLRPSNVKICMIAGNQSSYEYVINESTQLNIMAVQRNVEQGDTTFPVEREGTFNVELIISTTAEMKTMFP